MAVLGEGEVFRSSGRVDVDRVALDLLRLARFSSASIGGFPIPVWIAVPVTFTAPSARD